MEFCFSIMTDGFLWPCTTHCLSEPNLHCHLSKHSYQLDGENLIPTKQGYFTPASLDESNLSYTLKTLGYMFRKAVVTLRNLSCCLIHFQTKGVFFFYFAYSPECSDVFNSSMQCGSQFI